MIDISVIIPIYNAENTIEDTLKSVGEQTQTNIEIICVNDGSTDNTEHIIQNIKTKDKRIKYIYQPNKGAGAARNTGIKVAQGKYIAFLDSDDQYWNQDSLKVLYDKAEKFSANICGGEAICNGKRMKLQEVDEEGWIDFVQYKKDSMFWCFLFNRMFLINNNITFPCYRVYEDPVFFLKALIFATKIYAVATPVYKYNGTHQAYNMTLEKSKDFLKGISDNLVLSSEYGLANIHQKTVKTLREEACHYCEKYFHCCDIELFELLYKANISIDESLLHNKDSEMSTPYILPSMYAIWRASGRYYRFLNIFPVKLIKTIVNKLKIKG